MSRPRDPRPEPNFGHLLTDGDLDTVVISAHALRRFVERLQPDIPGADRVAEHMAALEDIGSGNRTGTQQAQLGGYRDWMTKHVRRHVVELIRCEGFWTAERPRWSRSDTPSDGYLQVGRMCGFPVAIHGHEIVLTTCTNGRDITWEVALQRGYTLMPKPYTGYTPPLLWPPSSLTIALRAWRTRSDHKGLLAAFRAERSQAVEDTQQENHRRRADATEAQRHWQQQHDRAAQAFRLRHATTEKSNRR